MLLWIVRLVLVFLIINVVTNPWPLLRRHRRLLAAIAGATDATRTKPIVDELAFDIPTTLQNPLLAPIAYNAYNICMQYTIRNVPGTLDQALRRAAREQGKSLNEVAIEALARGAGVTAERVRQRDLNDIAGTWRKDPAFDSARAAQDTIDEEMWR